MSPPLNYQQWKEAQSQQQAPNAVATAPVNQIEQNAIDMMNNGVSANNNAITNNYAQPPVNQAQSPAEKQQSLIAPAVSQSNQIEAGRIAAEAAAKARLELPGQIASAEQLHDVSNRMLGNYNQDGTRQGHPGLGGVVGMPNLAGVFHFPGSKEQDFRVLLEQMRGKAFMAAYSGLKGGGAITGPEGEKATVALAALQDSQSEESFMKNLKIFNDNVSTSVDMMKQRAGVTMPQQNGVLKPGDVDGGFTYMGGNPADKNSWRQ
jgi:hypothetical protein